MYFIGIGDKLDVGWSGELFEGRLEVLPIEPHIFPGRKTWSLIGIIDLLP
jgi:hypothetical protein